MKIFRTAMFAAIGLALAAAAGCASGPASAQSPPAPQQQSAAPSSGTSEYRLASGDQVKITVFGEPELSGSFPLDGQGVISMSLIGEVEAGNLTVRELQRLIEARLRAGYLRDPQVSAEVANFRPFYILGEVNRPGEYPYISGLTVMKAIASAGDFTYRADRKRIIVRRNDADKERTIVLTPTTEVQPGDTIRIRERFF